MSLKQKNLTGGGYLKKAVDFDAFKSLFSDVIIEGNTERYQFTWPDKQKARTVTNLQVTSTLRPCREESVNFDTTENLYIEGDNLEVLKLLQETYLGKIKMIYIDPPYNTGNDFIYEDDFSQRAVDYATNSGQYDELENRLVSNLESNGRYHTNWLNMMYSRLSIARDLLSDDGVIIISIDDNELFNLKKMCDEVLGQSNLIGVFVVNASPSAIDYGHMAKMHDYAIMWAKNIAMVTTNQLHEKNKEFKFADEIGQFNIYPLFNGNVAFNPQTRPNLYYPFYVNPNRKLDNVFYEIDITCHDGWIEVFPPVSRKDGITHVWRWGKDKAKENLNSEIVGYKNDSGEYRIVQKTRLTSKTIRSLLLENSMSSRTGTLEVEKLFSSKIFSFPKPTTLIETFLEVGTNRDSIILDFFSGSATTAHAVMKLNAKDGGHRKFIMVQLPETCDEKSEAYKAGYKNICEIGKERIRRAGKQILNDMKNKNGELFAEVSTLDIGFRDLKLDSSNMNDVYYTPDETDQRMLDGFVSNIKEDRTAEDLLFQVMLDLGVLLSAKIAEEDFGGKKVFNVGDNYLIACFDEDVDENVIMEAAKKKPTYFVMRDSSLANDSVSVNFDQIFARYSPDTIRKVL